MSEGSQNPVYTDNVTILGDGTEEHPLTASSSGLVESVNGATGAVVLDSPDSSINITETLPHTVHLEVATPSPVLQATLVLTAADLLALTAGYQIVSAPGAGKAIVILDWSLDFQFVTTAYTPGAAGQIGLGYNGSGGAGDFASVLQTGLIDQAVSTGVTPQAAANSNQSAVYATPIASAVNEGVLIDAGAVGTNPTLGDGTLSVTVWYSILPES